MSSEKLATALQVGGLNPGVKVGHVKRGVYKVIPHGSGLGLVHIQGVQNVT